MPFNPGTNTGDGHVWKRPDGYVKDCGGPAFCESCAIDAADAAAGQSAKPAESQPSRRFGYIPDPNFTEKFQASLAAAMNADTELGSLLAAERKAIFADTSAATLFPWIALVADGLADVATKHSKVGVLFAAAYQRAGGNLGNARRIFQLVAQAYVQKKLDSVDIPGPDDWIKPWVFELIIRFAGEGFDEATRQQ